MSSMQDYIGIYPDQYDPDIQRKISVKREFSILNGTPTEPIPVRGEKYKHQESFLRFMRSYDRIFNFSSTGSGKCNGFDTPILMFDGSIKMVQDVKRGDKVMGPDSKSRKVLGTTKGKGKMYTIVPNKGKTFTCNGPHVLSLMGTRPYITERKSGKSRFTVKFYKQGKCGSKAFLTREEAEDFMEEMGTDIWNISVEDYLALPKSHAKSKYYLYHVGVDFPDREVPIDPYMIGYWLGDGTSCRSEITTNDPEIVEYYVDRLPEIDCKIKREKDKSGMHYYISGINNVKAQGQKGRNKFLTSLKNLNLINNKHIPDIYKINSRENRLDLLAGLIDSDGHRDVKGNCFEISQVNEKLSDDIEYLCLSLGFMVTRKESRKGCPGKDGKMVYGIYQRMYIFGEGIEEVLTCLDRKQCTPRVMNKRATCLSFKIEESDQTKYYGFEVNKDHLFLLGNFLVTHNSCTMIGLAEYLKEHPGQYKHVYVLEKGANTKNDFRNQIVCRCTKPEVYETEAIRRATSTTARTTAITNEIKSWYTVTTYNQFGSDSSNMTPDMIKEKYSHTLILIDEAHILRNSKGKSTDEKKIRRRKKGKEDGDEKGESSKISLDKVYRNIFRVCHVADFIKVGVFTATPNINDVGDNIPLVNILLPLNRQMPYHIEDKTREKGGIMNESSKDITYDYRFVTVKQMEPFLRGILCYARALDTGVDVKNMGTSLGKSIKVKVADIYANAKPLVKINSDGSFTYLPQDFPLITTKNFTSRITVYPVKMSPFQSKIFYDAEKSGLYKGIGKKHHASEFVFPDGSFGGNFTHFLAPNKAIAKMNQDSTGIDKYVTSKATSEYEADPELIEILKSPDLLYKHSCKFYEILRIEEEDPDCNCFIFTDAVTGAGAILLALMFDQYGYTRYDRSESAFGMEIDEKTGKNVRKILIPPGKRYCILSNESKDGKISGIMELFNDPVNKNGKYCRMAIGCPVARDGINLHNVKRGYLLRAGWHPSGDLQALSRFLRAVSHEALLAEKREDYLERGIAGEVRMEVQIYRMCSYTHKSIVEKGRKEAQRKKDISSVKKEKNVSSSEEEQKPKKSSKKKKKNVSSSEEEQKPKKSSKKKKKNVSSSEEEQKSKKSSKKKKKNVSSSEEEQKPKKSSKKKKKNVSSSEEEQKPKKSSKKKKKNVSSSEEEQKSKKSSKKKKKNVSSSEEEQKPKKSSKKKKKNVSSSEEEQKSKKSISTINEGLTAITPKRSKSQGYVVPMTEVAHLMSRTTGIFDYPINECISIDIQLYIRGEKKDFYNRRMMRIWKILAIDAINNEKRNFLIKDEPGSIDTDYIMDKFIPYGRDPRFYDEMGKLRKVINPMEAIVAYKNQVTLPETDYSTYDVLYFDKEIEHISTKIISGLIQYGSLPIEKFFSDWGDKGIYRKKLIWTALYNLAYQHTEMTDRLGFTTYVNTGGGSIFLQNEFPFIKQDNNDDLIYYSNIVTGVVTTPISEVLDDILSPQQEAIIDEILHMKGSIREKEQEKIQIFLSKLTLNYRAALIERILLVWIELTNPEKDDEQPKEKKNLKINYIDDKSTIVEETSSEEKPKKATPSKKAASPHTNKIKVSSQKKRSSSSSPIRKRKKTPSKIKRRSTSSSPSKEKKRTPSHKRSKTPSKITKSPSSETSSIKIKAQSYKEQKSNSDINPEVINYLMSRFKLYIYLNVLEPHGDINHMAKVMSKKINKTQKDKSKKDTIKVVYSGKAGTNWAHKNGIPYKKGEDIIDDDVVKINRVYLHTLYSTEDSLVSYKTTSKFRNVAGKIRIYKPAEELGWRDTSPYEYGIYKALIQEEMQVRMAKYEVHGIYGAVMSDGEFRLVDRNKESKDSGKDKRKRSGGDICRQKSRPDLIRILIDKNITSARINDVKVDTTLTRKKIIADLVKKNFSKDISSYTQYPIERLRFIQKIYLSNVKREYMCELLRDKFESEERILYAN
jgi:hypothetical protein